jgi:aldehyde dehydrogenase (NAD+)
MKTQVQESQLKNASEQEIKEVFDLQKKYAPELAVKPISERLATLKKLGSYITENVAVIQEALYNDYKKNPDEVMVSEIVPVGTEVKHAISNLKKWTKPQKTAKTLSMLTVSSYVLHEPKGVCLIISPWNYPFSLTLKPLISAIAAGNTVMIKPSEMVSHTSAFLAKMMNDLFDKKEVAIFQGDYTVSTNLLKLPFDHIFFTGSPAVGKIVMRAAAENLSSVTLELGGKSPTIIDETANLKTSAERIAWGKFLNNGQTCIAPDYLFVHESVKDAFLKEFEAYVQKMYNAEGKGIENSSSYCRIVNQRHFQRVKGLLDQAKAAGAKVEFGGETNEAENYIAPTVLTGVKEDMEIMIEEIFAPLLPVMTYKDKKEVIQSIRSREKPLSLYIYSSNKQNIDFFIKNTSAGGTVINDSLIQFSHPNVPFGGVNNSGIGKSGGEYGFIEFSNPRGILKQNLGMLNLIYPPYNEGVSKKIKLLWNLFFKP